MARGSSGQGHRTIFNKAGSMRISRPSSAMVVAGIALLASLRGTSITAVNYARRAGPGGGKSDVAGNAPGAPQAVAVMSGWGTVTATCD
jgi:hypothetical protein